MHLAYVAGLVDGEGSIGFTRIRGRIYPRVFITNTNVSLLEEIKDQFGGDVMLGTYCKAEWKRAYHWRISNSSAVEFLDRISPWLRLKYNQALLMFAWDAIRPGYGGKWTQEGLEACDLLNAQRKWLNARGLADRGPEPMEVALAQ